VPLPANRSCPSSCGPYDGALITLHAICGLACRESDADAGMVSVAIPLLGPVAVVVLCTLCETF
jgi:hypothetical protein